jgi:hypothetical protein
VLSSSLANKLFLGFAFLVQILLLLNFAARNWQPELEMRYGWLVYATGILALLLALLSWRSDRPLAQTAAYLIFALWAAFGYYVDIYRAIPWRSPPFWPIFIPYVLLFMAGQFAFWIPLWYLGRGYWWAYTVAYALNTALNIFSHR